MRKFLIAFFAVICLSCLAAAACGKTKYYSLEYIIDEDCVTIESTVQSGAQVKEGYEVVFKLVVADNALGEAEVKANGTVLNPDDSGNYKIKITSDTTIEVTGVYLPGMYEVTFDRQGDDFIDFLDLEGNSLEVVEASSEEVISFKVHVSIYYDGEEYSVSAGSAILRPDENGVYSYTVTGKTTISVNGINSENLVPGSFGNRNGDGVSDGNGTTADPFRIRTARDLYIMYYAITNPFFISGTYQLASYRLENDIDMQGERLFIIGDATTEMALFAGEFDGNGHTISNYRITDTKIDQSTFTTVHLQAVGFFGFASSAYIHDLNLEGFTITTNGTEYNDFVYVGGLVGYGIGTTVTNCSVSGSIIADGGALVSSDGSLTFSFIGGLMGVQQSFGDESSRQYSIIQSCNTDVELQVQSGFVYGAGGITGFMVSSDERANAAILNCYATGKVLDAARAGGIVGIMGPDNAVMNCYATGIIEARSNNVPMDGYEMFSDAYAGGIAGYARYGGVVSGCFFTGELYTNAPSGARTGVDGIIGVIDESGTEYIYTTATVGYNNASTSATSFGTRVNLINDDYIKNTLGWSVADWTFNSNGTPVINKDVASKKFTVTIMVDGEVYSSNEIDSEGDYDAIYIPMSYWYLVHDDVIPEFIGSGEARTFGYFFDADLTLKVPFGFIPTDDIVLYAAYADYTKVTGDYYIKDSSAYVTLNDEGYLVYRNGAINCVSTYVYDGENIWLYNTFLAIAAGRSEEFLTFKAEISNGVMSIYDLEYFLASNPLTATKKSDTFRYGTYFGADGKVYTFNKDGTGVISSSTSNDLRFTYTVNGAALTAVVDGINQNGVVGANGIITSLNNIALEASDEFIGTWEGAFGTNGRYHFDGKGNWTYTTYKYEDGEEVVVSTESGTYEVNEGVLTFENSVTATLHYSEISEGGVALSLLYLDVNGFKFYREYSFAGTWVYTVGSEIIELTLMGLNDDGYGVAYLDYSGQSELMVVNYGVINLNGTFSIAISLYYNEYGFLEFDPDTLTLKGEIYSLFNDKIITSAMFCCYDDIKGEWSSGNSEEFTKIKFNGLSGYDINGSANNAPVSGMAVVYKGTESDIVTYTYANGEGTFNYNHKTYNFIYNEELGTITVQADGDAFTLTEVE